MEKQKVENKNEFTTDSYKILLSTEQVSQNHITNFCIISNLRNPNDKIEISLSSKSETYEKIIDMKIELKVNGNERHKSLSIIQPKNNEYIEYEEANSSSNSNNGKEKVPNDPINNDTFSQTFTELEMPTVDKPKLLDLLRLCEDQQVSLEGVKVDNITLHDDTSSAIKIQLRKVIKELQSD